MQGDQMLPWLVFSKMFARYTDLENNVLHEDGFDIVSRSPNRGEGLQEEFPDDMLGMISLSLSYLPLLGIPFHRTYSQT